MTPYLMTGGTDSRHYAELAGGRVFRFLPLPFNRSAGGLSLFHGVDERVATADLMGAVRFYVRLLELAAGPEGPEE